MCYILRKTQHNQPTLEDKFVRFIPESAVMSRDQLRRDTTVTMSRDCDDERYLLKMWASQIITRNLLKTQTLKDGLEYMLDKPVGHCAFMKPYNGERFVLLVRGHEKNTARYTIAPDENHRVYILCHTLQGQQDLEFASIDDLIDHCKTDISQFMQDREDYNMIRKLEMCETVRADKSEDSGSLQVMLEDLNLMSGACSLDLNPTSRLTCKKQPNLMDRAEVHRGEYGPPEDHCGPRLHRSREMRLAEPSLSEHLERDERDCSPQRGQRGRTPHRIRTRHGASTCVRRAGQGDRSLPHGPTGATASVGNLQHSEALSNYETLIASTQSSDL